MLEGRVIEDQRTRERAMRKTILMPIDISQHDAAVAALRFARETLNVRDAKFILLNILPQIPAFIAAEVPGEFPLRFRDEANTAMKTFVSEHDLGADTEIVVREGRPGPEILAFAEEAHPDFILISSHDPRVSDILFGSVAAHVVRHAHCSVVVVRNVEA